MIMHDPRTLQTTPGALIDNGIHELYAPRGPRLRRSGSRRANLQDYMPGSDVATDRSCIGRITGEKIHLNVPMIY